MSTTTSRFTTTQAERIDDLVRAHKEEVARLRKEFPNPSAALSDFVRERFDLAALLPSVLAADEINEIDPNPEEDLDAW